MYYGKQSSSNTNYYNAYRNDSYRSNNENDYLTRILRLLIIILFLGVLFVAYLSITNGAKDVAKGFLNGVSFGLANVVTALLGNAFIDVPEMWEDSSMEIPSYTFTMQLRSPYGHPISILQTLYLPLSMIMGLGIPPATGRSSYGSPMLLRADVKGKCKIEKGMITNLSITRGPGNMGYSSAGRAISLDITFTITDFDRLMTSPVNGDILNILKAPIDDTSSLGRFLTSLAGRDLLTDKYFIPKAKIRFSKIVQNADQLTNPAFWGFRGGNALHNILGGFVADHNLVLNN
jgi:hypothetical protein